MEIRYAYVLLVIGILPFNMLKGTQHYTLSNNFFGKSAAHVFNRFFRQFWTDLLGLLHRPFSNPNDRKNFAKLYWIFQKFDNLTCTKIPELVLRVYIEGRHNFNLIHVKWSRPFDLMHIWMPICVSSYCCLSTPCWIVTRGGVIYNIWFY